MGDNSRIEWCDATYNPVTGCTPVSDGCTNCYAKRMAERFPKAHGIESVDCATGRETPVPFDNIEFHEDRLDQPLRWKKPRRIFVCSMGDLFHEDVKGGHLKEIWFTMMLAKQHTFMVLTKRPENIRAKLSATAAKLNSGDPFACKTMWPPNLWFGVTAENQEMADERIPILLQAPAAVRFVSVEPCLGPVDLRRYLVGHEENGVDPEMRRPVGCCLSWTPPIDWVIAGCESGPKRREADLYWFRDLRDQCIHAETPFFLKQMEVNGKVVKMPPLDGHTYKGFPNG